MTWLVSQLLLGRKLGESFCRVRTHCTTERVCCSMHCKHMIPICIQFFRLVTFTTIHVETGLDWFLLNQMVLSFIQSGMRINFLVLCPTIIGPVNVAHYGEMYRY